jgi:hypothetical protein
MAPLGLTAGTANVSVASLVETAPSITAQPTNVTVNVGKTAVFQAAASATPTAKVQWQTSTDGKNWHDVAGGTMPTLSLRGTTPAQDGAEYRARFTNRVGSATTNAATLTVLFAPVVTSQPVAATVAVAGQATFTAAAHADPQATVQWQASMDNGKHYASITGATSATLSFGAQLSDSATLYRAVFSNTLGTIVTHAARLTVDVPTAVTVQPTSQTVAARKAAVFHAAATGSPSATVQWQVSADGGKTWSKLTGATATSLQINRATPTQDGNQYRAVFTNPVGTVITNPATLTVTFAPAISLEPMAQLVALGNPVNFVAAAKGDPPATVQWYISSDQGKHYSLVPGATSPTLAFTPQQTDSGSQYRAVFTSALGNATSNSAALTVDVPPALTTQPAAQEIVAGKDASFSAAATATPAATIQWQTSADYGATWHDIAGATRGTLASTA